LAQLRNLWFLNLRGNQFTGEILAGLSQLSTLKLFDLGCNQFVGVIPPELAQLTNLKRIYLDGNQLTGAIPRELAQLTNLRRLYLNDNQLVGNIPPELAQLNGLRYVDLSGNRLTGNIPPELGGLSNLLGLYLRGNKFTGGIPSSLQNLVNLTDNGSDFRWNALYASDKNLRLFLNSKQVDGDWESTQTVAPRNLFISKWENGDAALSWDVIPYTGDAGAYIVEYSETPKGPWVVGNMTADKQTSSIIQSGLNPALAYYFRIQTLTNPHANNKNDVFSEYSNICSTLPVQKGDINGDGNVDLTDAIMALQIAVNIDSGQKIYKAADIDNDGKLRIEEAIFILGKAAGLR